MTQQELDALQGLCDGATAGPWDSTLTFHDRHYIRTPSYGVRDFCCLTGDLERKIDADFIAAARTAMPALIAEVRKLTRETEFLRKAYHEKSALIRLLIDTQALAQTVAEGPFKDYYDRVAPLPNCNDCGRKGCEYRPRPGDQVRINCPLWRGPQPTDEPNA